MIRPILKYGAPELQTQSTSIDRVNEEIRTLAQDMLETMYAAPGIGLAAPQVGVNLRLIVLDISGGEETGHQLILTNPKVTEQEGTQEAEEGCLSVPGFTALVERPSRIHVIGQDLEGNPQEIDAEGLLARAICHEIDHLDGMLYLNRLSVLKRDLIKRKIRKLIRAGEW
ncbi:MAG: peptide deformylase [Acidobacteria bacterium]|nr:peptide deformylase [Acidobacteriota bacterium]MCZ6878695.1 peptide deformylase [Acidobacteriota bacterium]